MMEKDGCWIIPLVAELPGGTVGHEGHLTQEIWAWPEMRNESW